MRKLRLDLEQLQVESFATANGAADRGTVKGNAEIEGFGVAIAEPAITVPVGTLKNTCMIDFCPDSWMSGCLTCAGSCVDTCQASCKTCNTCFGNDTCYGAATCLTLCLRTCPSGGDVCCA